MLVGLVKSAKVVKNSRHGGGGVSEIQKIGFCLLWKVPCQPIELMLVIPTFINQEKYQLIHSGTAGSKTVKTTVLPGFWKIELDNSSGGAAILWLSYLAHGRWPRQRRSWFNHLNGIKIDQMKWTIMHVLLTALLIHHLQFPLMPVW